MLGTLAKQYVSTNLANPKLMNDVMKQIPVLLPPTLAEQTAIATVLTDMDAEIVALEHRREKTRALKQGMMQELLTGKTRLL
jgi:type I restriction enzyme S subunit